MDGGDDALSMLCLGMRGKGCLGYFFLSFAPRKCSFIDLSGCNLSTPGFSEFIFTYMQEILLNKVMRSLALPMVQSETTAQKI
jgi:hypothetical protein